VQISWHPPVLLLLLLLLPPREQENYGNCAPSLLVLLLILLFLLLLLPPLLLLLLLPRCFKYEWARQLKAQPSGLLVSPSLIGWNNKDIKGTGGLWVVAWLHVPQGMKLNG